VKYGVKFLLRDPALPCEEVQNDVSLDVVPHEKPSDVPNEHPLLPDATPSPSNYQAKVIP
jgi:hypothetical protein